MAARKCFLCSRSTEKQPESNSPGMETSFTSIVKNSYETNLFLKLACRYLHIKIALEANLKQETCDVCDSCKIETRQFCQLYHEWFQLQLKLNEKAKIISGLIGTTSKSQETGTTGSHQGFSREIETFREQFRTRVGKIKESEIPRPVLQDVAKKVKLEITEKPTILQDLKVCRDVDDDNDNDAKISKDLPDHDERNLLRDPLETEDDTTANDSDDATASGNDGHLNQCIPLQKPETNDLDLNLSNGGGNEVAQELLEPEQITFTRPIPAPVPNILKRKRNGCNKNNPDEKKNDRVPHEEVKRYKPKRTRNSNSAKKNRRFPQEKVKSYSRIQLAITHSHHCRFCEKKFNVKQDRHEHEVSHLGIKPFLCVICHKKFLLQRYCARHLKEVHGIHSLEGNIERKCDKCGRMFGNGYSLMKHIFSEHLPPEDCEHCNSGRRDICGHFYMMNNSNLGAEMDEGDLEVEGIGAGMEMEVITNQGEHVFEAGSVFLAKTEKMQESLELHK